MREVRWLKTGSLTNYCLWNDTCIWRRSGTTNYYSNKHNALNRYCVICIQGGEGGGGATIYHSNRFCSLIITVTWQSGMDCYHFFFSMVLSTLWLVLFGNISFFPRYIIRFSYSTIHLRLQPMKQISTCP